LIFKSRPFYTSGDTFYIYKIDEHGIINQPALFTASEPLLSYCMVFFGQNNSFFLRSAVIASRLISFSFDNATGSVSELYSYNFSGAIKRINTSPDGTKLYIIENYDLYQCDLTHPHPTDVLATKTAIETNATFHYLEKNIHGKIVCSSLWTNMLSIIHQPDSLGLLCNLSLYDIVFDNQAPASTMSLPNSIVDLNYSSSFIWKDVCLGDTTKFQYLQPDCETTIYIEWDFGDPQSGNNTSFDLLAQHYYGTPGNYIVRLVTSYGSENDTVYKTIRIVNNDLDLGPDHILTPGDTFLIDPGYPFHSFQWHDGSTGQQFHANTSGIYSLTVTDRFGCILSDTLTVTLLNIEERDPASFSVIPVPAQNFLYITSDLGQSGTLTILSGIGQNVKNEKLSGTMHLVNLSALPAGVYYLIIRSDSGNHFSQRFIKI
jgi:hypothetical protein